MPNDAKLGLVLGTGLVIIIAVVFCRRYSATAHEQPDRPGAAAAVNPPGMLPTISSRGDSGGVMQSTAGTRPVPARGLQHTVQEGDTLFSLAQNYYKDGSRFVDIYRTNQQVVRTPDRLEPGTVLVIPGVPE